MQVSYNTLVGTTPKIIELNTNAIVFNVTVRADAGITVEQAVEQPADSVAPNSYTAPATTIAPVWGAVPAAVNGLINLLVPVSALRFTPTAGGNVVVLQQGIR